MGERVLACREGDDAGLVHRLESGACLIGAAPGCDLQVEGEGLARRHALVAPARGGWVAEDLGSDAGTWVDDERLEPGVPVPLAHGSVLRFGRTCAWTCLDVDRVPRAQVIGASLVAPSGESVPLRPGDNVIGRDPDSDLVVADVSVQESHARLRLGDRNLLVEPLGDAHVTLGGREIRGVTAAEDGDVLGLSDSAEFPISVLRGRATSSSGSGAVLSRPRRRASAATAAAPAAERSDASLRRSGRFGRRSRAAVSISGQRPAAEPAAGEARARVADGARARGPADAPGAPRLDASRTTQTAAPLAPMSADTMIGSAAGTLRFHLRIPRPADGGPEERTVLLGMGRHVVGRGDGCAVWLPDLSVSRRHAELIVDRDEVLVRDLGSSNGTWCGNRPLDEDRVAPGERFRLGDVEVWYEST